MHVRSPWLSSTGSVRRRLCTVLFLFLLLSVTMAKLVTRNDVYDVYRSDKIDGATSREGQNKPPKLPSFILLFLFSVDPLLKFNNTVQIVINQSLKNCSNFSPQQAAKAFRHIETFALNLVEFPWQREFKTIRLYTGFWKLKIERHLFNALPLFERMGYTETEDDVLSLTHPASRDTLIELGADCYSASAELDLYTEILQIVDQQGFDIHDVHNCRTSVQGNKEAAVDWINRNCNPTFKKIQDNFKKRASHSEDSLLAVELLDLVEQTNDSGYISKPQSTELPLVRGEPYPQQARVSSVEEEDVFTPRAWDDQIQSSYRFIDRTAPKSERMLPSTTPSMSMAASSDISSVHGTSAEWDHVRRGLQQKFGEEYYAGLRGDYILGKIESGKNNTINPNGGVQDSPPVAVSVPKPAPVSAPRVITADVHTPSPMSPGAGKIASIKKSTNRRQAPPVPIKSCAQQYQQQNSQMEEFLTSTQLQTDSSPDIKHPPATFPLLGTQYEAPNFTTFGHTDSAMIGHAQSSEPRMELNMDSAVFEAGIGNGTGHSLARRMYQADSLQSLNKDDFPPPPSPHQLQHSTSQVEEPYYSKPVKSLKQLPKVPQYGGESKPHFLTSERNNTKPAGKEVKRHTAPIVPRRPAPSPPTRTHHTEPLLRPVTVNCPHCTYANTELASVCQMCQAPLRVATTQACPKCTYVSSSDATKCKICLSDFTS